MGILPFKMTAHSLNNTVLKKVYLNQGRTKKYNSILTNPNPYNAFLTNHKTIRYKCENH